ncbi:hypothetical protein JIN77_07315 [Verrucomicrobiaceae bacterium R5-34]|nr:hypothetical protein [Verrucomicrobiaceae bacterium R5-34]
MGEVVNIATLAESASDKLFTTFGWQIGGIKDENFPCVNQTKHQKKTAKTHPVDCVFSYNDPYTEHRHFLLCDLKSYAASTMDSTDFKPYLQGLAKAAECAQVETTWKGRYVDSSISAYSVDGFLFVYNHDGDYKKDFSKKGRNFMPSSLQGAMGSRVHLMGPDTINRLQSIAHDLKARCTDHDLDYNTRKFFYPQQPLKMPAASHLDSADIETLRGRRIIVRLQHREDPKKISYFVYLHSESSVEAIEYLITFLYKNRIVEDAAEVIIVGIGMRAEAQVDFNNAKKQFLERHFGMLELSRSLEKISLTRLTMVAEVFCSVDEATLRS